MSRVSQEELAERLAVCEQTMLRQRSAFRVEQELKQRFGVDGRTVRRWMQTIRNGWKKQAREDTPEERAARRVEMEKTLNEVLASAMNRTIIVKDKDGNPILDSNPNSPSFGKPLVKANPDLQRVLHACIQLRAMGGLDAPTRSHVTVAPDISGMPDLSKLPETSVEKLKEFLGTIAPDGDIRQLAGEWFTQHVPEKKE